MANVSACDLWTQGGLGQIGLAFLGGRGDGLEGDIYPGSAGRS